MGGGAWAKTVRLPHEARICLSERPALLGNLEAHASALQGPGGPGLDRLPVPRSPRRWTYGQAERNLSARALHEGVLTATPLPVGVAPAIARHARGSSM